MSDPTSEVRVPVGELLRLIVPAFAIGTFCALTLVALTELAALLEHWLWGGLADSVGIDPDSPLWIIGILTSTGLAIGLVVRYAPGHAGPDPATHGLVSVPLAPRVLPGLAVAMVLTLAGGVSLGPENPIMAINAALVVAVGAQGPASCPGAFVDRAHDGGDPRGDVRHARRSGAHAVRDQPRRPARTALGPTVRAARRRHRGRPHSARLDDVTFDVELLAYAWGGAR